jgi:hypothetical protein
MSPAEALDYTRLHYDGSAAPPGPSPYFALFAAPQRLIARDRNIGDHRADIVDQAFGVDVSGLHFGPLAHSHRFRGFAPTRDFGGVEQVMMPPAAVALVNR